jgi:hypothetical protein
MMLKRKSSQSQRSAWTLLRAGLAGLAVMIGGAAATVGCLDRPVAPAVPKTSNIYVDEIRQTAVDKIDLLFMIDNSISMADKQEILAAAVPNLVTRLITPLCVDPCTDANCTEQQRRDGIPAGGNADASGMCGNGEPEFPPIRDIHIGIVTSSLGAHGAGASPKDVCISAEDDDHAQLLGAIRPGLMPYDGNGFLKWDTTDPAKYQPPGDSNPAAFNDKFTAMVVSSGEHGCGYEASLEAWYRFLIDPEPPSTVSVPMGSATSVVGPADGTVIAQRQAFLRADSLVAIIMLTDENDCSIVDEGYGWLIARSAPMYRSTSVCHTNPNDPCCQSCGEQTANSGCGAPSADAECQTANGAFLNGNAGEDDLNLRCWQQKRRFGFELLYPTTRYADGLRSPVVPLRSTGEMVTNPLFAAAEGTAPRDKGLVFLAGIIGVPWQDIADEDSLNGAGLRYMTSTQLTSAGRWDVILGDPAASPPIGPTDPMMVEQPDERIGLGTNPITGDAIVASSSNNPQENSINGHEQANMGNHDLQYACIFPLTTPLTCDQAAFDADEGCDCFDSDLVFNRPLCQPPGGGAAGITQHFAKAYPGLRHLQVLRDFGENSVVASICPKVLDTGEADYGYNPAVKAIIDRLKDALKGKCLPRPLVPASVDAPVQGLEPGQVPCAVVEAVLPQNGTCTCDPGQARLDLTDRPELRTAVLNKLAQNQSCGVKGGTPCESYCTCEIAQFSGADLMTCQNQKTPGQPGYCYVNATPGEPNVGNPDLVAECPADSKRLLNFGANTPQPGAIALVACLGASLGSTL